MKAESSIINATRHRARGAKTDDDDDLFPYYLFPPNNCHVESGGRESVVSRQIFATWNHSDELRSDVDVSKCLNIALSERERDLHGERGCCFITR